MSLLSWFWNKFGKNDPDSQNARPDEFGRNGYGLASPSRELGQDIDYVVGRGKDIVSDLWKDYTGQSAIEQEYQNNMDLAKYQTQMNEEFYKKYSSPEALMSQYDAAGLNRNLIYGSASSGQSNVPSFSAPQAIRSLSGVQKLNAVMQLFSGLVNMRNILYNSEAAREASEQAQLKTQSLWQDLYSKTRNNMLKDAELGGTFGFNIKPFWRRSSSYESYVTESDNVLAYAKEARKMFFNRSMSSYGKNLWEFGSAYNGIDSDMLPTMSNQAYRNLILKYDYKQRSFNYDWDDQYRTMMKSLGIAGQLGGMILRALKL